MTYLGHRCPSIRFKWGLPSSRYEVQYIIHLLNHSDAGRTCKWISLPLWMCWRFACRMDAGAREWVSGPPWFGSSQMIGGYYFPDVVTFDRSWNSNSKRFNMYLAVGSFPFHRFDPTSESPLGFKMQYYSPQNHSDTVTSMHINLVGALIGLMFACRIDEGAHTWELIWGPPSMESKCGLK